MEFKAQKTDIDQSNPFKNDTLNRKPHVENLSILLENISSPIVLSVNAPWGQGKTTFLEMLNAQLKSKEHKSIYFSAWETDFASDPLQAFLGEINEQIESFSQKNEAWEKTKKAGAHIAKTALPAVMKAATYGVLDAEKFLEDGASKLAESLTKDFLEEYTKNKEAIAQFKTGIAQILDKGNGENTRLFIFIDELDRCRPTYAIELLERIKHLLDIEGLVFVLAMDKVQLSHSVKSIYGSEFEAIGYLRRFIDIEYALPEAEIDAFIDQLYVNFGFNEFFTRRKEDREYQYDQNHLKNTMKILAKYKNLSLRDVEFLFAKINLVIKSTEENRPIYPALLTFLIIAKEYHVEAYNDYMNEDGIPEKLIEVLHSMIPEPILIESHSCRLIEGLLIKAKNTNGDGKVGNIIKRHERIVMDKSSSEAQAQYSEAVIYISNNSGMSSALVDLNNLRSRIDMSENFYFDRDEKE